jgi:hypothetical protein
MRLLEEKTDPNARLYSRIWNKQIYLYDISLWLDGDNITKCRLRPLAGISEISTGDI